MRHLVLFLISFLSLTACNSGSKQQVEGERVADSSSQAVENATLTADDRGPSITLDAPVMLSYRMKVGDTFGYKIEDRQDILLMQDTIANHNVQNLTWWYHFEVLEANPGGAARLRATCDRVLFDGRYDGPGGKRSMKYDSDEKNTYDLDKQYAQYNAPVHTPFVIVVEQSGRIADITELTEVIRNFMKDDFRTTKSNQINAIAKDYADQNLKGTLQIVFQKLSEAPVGKDSTWMISTPDRLGYLAMQNSATYKVRDVVESPLGRVAHVDVTLTKTYVGKKKVDTGDGMATMSEFEARGKGSTVFNIDKGALQRRRLRNTVKVRMWVEPPDELKQMTKGTPQEVHDFWWTLNGITENVIEPYLRP
ncbi:MAG: DUF6263 family protein [Bacteroidota bacterium]